MRRFNAVVALVALVGSLALWGCSSSTSPSDVDDWWLGATWSGVADHPPGSYLGTAFLWDGDDTIYATRGGVDGFVRDFWTYSISSDAWTQLGDVSFDPYWSCSMAWPGGDYIYVPQGNGTSAFYRYTISTDTWDSMADYPEDGVRRMGRSVVWPGSGDYIYAAKGNQEATFFRYHIPSDAWEYLTPIPVATVYGSSICWGGGGRIFAAVEGERFFEYRTSSDSWTEKAPYPAPIDFGSYLTFDGMESIFMTRGAETDTLWRYDIPTDEWEQLDNLPATLYRGAATVFADNALYAVPGEYLMDFWVYKE
ncbi:MAG: hypothetical protein ABIE42_03050 [Candidatus Eisenbacteria bacterium]